MNITSEHGKPADEPSTLAEVDVTDPVATSFTVQVPLSATRMVPADIAAWVFAPTAAQQQRRSHWLLALPGGSYRERAYYDRQVPGYPSTCYSMARALASSGIGVIVIDHLGTGYSVVATPSEGLTRQVLAAAYDILITQLRTRLDTGTLLPTVDPIPSERLWLGVMGHSLGGLLATQLQGTYHSADGLALLGWTNRPEEQVLDHLSLTSEQREELMAGLSSGYYTPSALATEQQAALVQQQRALRPFFYSSRVKAALIEADEQDATVVPAGLADCLHPGVTAEEATQIRCPLFLGFGGVDVTSTPAQEVMAYPAANAITLLVQPLAHHCTNFGSCDFLVKPTKMVR